MTANDVRPIRTLIVDDDFRVADLHARFVQSAAGFVVCGVAHTAAEARDLADAQRPDLVLLDLYLPDTPGLDLMRELVAQDPAPGVIVITAARDVAHVRTALAQGAVHYLVKPFRMAALTERLEAFRDLHARLADLDAQRADADQADVDALFRLMRTGTVTQPPKGQSAETLRLVRDAVRRAAPDVSAAEVASTLGISRPTAQRYLSALARQGVIDLHLQYGTTGRPEHRYRPVR